MEKNNNKKILLTGGAGFIGSHVAEMLVHRYPHYTVVVLDKMDYCASKRNLEFCITSPNFRLIKGDIQSMDCVMHILRVEKIDTVIHFAAQTHVDNSFGNSVSFTMNNTLGTHVLLESCRCVGGITRFVNVSTDEVYGDTSVDLLEGLEEDRSSLAPTNPYSAAKAGAEMLCRAYSTSYGLPIIITRSNNVYGPRQYPEKLIPKFIMLARMGKSLPIHGDGSAIRSYLYIDDVVEAFDRIIHDGQVGHTYNIGTDNELTITQVANDIRALVTPSSSEHRNVETHNVRDRVFNDRRYFIGSHKLRETLGWVQRVEWEEGLRLTADWYVALLDRGEDEANAYWPQGSLTTALSPHPII